MDNQKTLRNQWYFALRNHYHTPEQAFRIATRLARTSLTLDALVSMCTPEELIMMLRGAI